VIVTGALELMPETTTGSDVAASAGAFPVWAGKENVAGVVSTTGGGFEPDGEDPEPPPPPPHPASSANNKPIETKRGK
jgi:hypothetical protein